MKKLSNALKLRRMVDPLGAEWNWVWIEIGLRSLCMLKSDFSDFHSKVTKHVFWYFLFLHLFKNSCGYRDEIRTTLIKHRWRQSNYGVRIATRDWAWEQKRSSDFFPCARAYLVPDKVKPRARGSTFVLLLHSVFRRDARAIVTWCVQDALSSTCSATNKTVAAYGMDREVSHQKVVRKGSLINSVTRYMTFCRLFIPPSHHRNANKSKLSVYFGVRSAT